MRRSDRRMLYVPQRCKLVTYEEIELLGKAMLERLVLAVFLLYNQIIVFWG